MISKLFSVRQMDGTKTQIYGTTFMHTPDGLLSIYDGTDLIAMFSKVSSVRIGRDEDDPSATPGPVTPREVAEIADVKATLTSLEAATQTLEDAKNMLDPLGGKAYDGHD